MSEQEPRYKSQEFGILGDSFTRVCDSYGLEPDQIDIIDSVLTEFSGRPAEIVEKLRVLSERVEDDSQMEDIASAMVEISHKYIERHPLSPLGKFARRSGLN